MDGRESYSLFINPHSWLRLRSWRWYKQLMFEDTFMPIICGSFGHNTYYINNYMVCSRCHRHLNQVKEVTK